LPNIKCNSISALPGDLPELPVDTRQWEAIKAKEKIKDEE
jgi:hypothetical protein